MRVCILGAFQPDYARHYVIREGLQRVGVEVELRPIPLEYRTPGRVRHLSQVFPRDEKFDAIIIPAFNQLLAPFVWGLGQIYRQPILLDYLIGLVDAAEDRGKVSGAKKQIFRLVDQFNTTRMTTLTDTNAHREAFQKLLGKPLHRMRVLPVGVRDLPMLPLADGEIVVQYTGTYIPFHGVEVILRAAKMLPEIRFELIGKGQTYPAAIKRVAELKLKNAHFVPGYFPKDELMAMQTRSTIMLGVFADAPKTRYVVPTKIFEALALGRPIITAESPALSEFFTPGEQLITVPPADPTALADAILELADSPQKQEALRLAGRSRIESEFLPEHIGAHLKAILEHMR